MTNHPSTPTRLPRGQAVGRPKALDKTKAVLARRMHTCSQAVSIIVATLAVSRATVHPVLSEKE
jgi:hypothetical protein